MTKTQLNAYKRASKKRRTITAEKYVIVKAIIAVMQIPLEEAAFLSDAQKALAEGIKRRLAKELGKRLK